LLAVKLKFNINRAAEVLPEAWTESWNGVEIVKRVREIFWIVITALVECWFSDVDVTACI